MRDKIFIVTHKKINKKINKKNYSYIQVNTQKNGDLGFDFQDNIGDNISEKNSNYCELTALYWIYKNYDCQDENVVGLCHYRRFFSKIKLPVKFFYPSIFSIKKYLKKFNIIVPKKLNWDISVKNMYCQCEGKEKDLNKTREIINKIYPDYVESFDQYINGKSSYYFNMMICKKSLFDKYCEWLFNILFELEKETDLTEYTVQQARIYGYLSELLLNVYIIKNELDVKEMVVVNTEQNIFKRIKSKICKS